MQYIELFIEEINKVCDDGEFWKPVTIDHLKGAHGEPMMTEDELVELDRALGEFSVPAALEDLYEFYDGGDPRKPIPPIVCAAYEWLVGPFAVSHKDYDPYWFRTFVPLQEPECVNGECPTCNEEVSK